MDLQEILLHPLKKEAAVPSLSVPQVLYGLWPFFRESVIAAQQEVSDGKGGEAV